MIEIDKFPLLLNGQATINDALLALNASDHKIALITNEGSQLIGTLTDGDIRRAMLRGLGLGDPIATAMNPNPKSLFDDEALSIATQVAAAAGSGYVPLIDRQRQVKGMLILFSVTKFQEKPNRVVIMAGGKGKRLRPLTETVPKPMLEIHGRPILEQIIENFVGQGFRNIAISVNYRGDMIQNYFGNGARWGASIDYIVDDHDDLGTAGSLRLFRNDGHLPFIVINGDIITRLDFDDLLKFQQETKAAASVAVNEYVAEIPFGVIDVDGHRVNAIREKPTYSYLISAGIYVLTHEVLAQTHDNIYLDMPTLLQRLMSAGQLVTAYRMSGPWIDIGRPKDLARANEELSLTESVQKVREV